MSDGQTPPPDPNQRPRRRPGRPTRPITRGELLTISREAFAQRGYDGVSMADIAQRAGLQKSSLFHHFATKDELYAAVMQDVFDEFTGQIRTAAALPGGFLERMDALTESVVRTYGRSPTLARLMLRELLAIRSADAPIARAQHVVMEHVAAFVQAGIDEGALPRRDHRHALATISLAHLTYFSVLPISEPLVHGSVFDPQMIEERVAAMKAHARLLFGVTAK